MILLWPIFAGAGIVFALSSVFIDTDPEQPLYFTQMSIASCIMCVVLFLVAV